MALKVEKSEGNVQYSREEKKVITTNEFNDLLDQNPELVVSFLDLNKKLENNEYDEGDVLEDINGTVQIEVLKHFKKDEYFGDGGGYHLKATFGGKSFFVKTIPGFLGHGESKGADEFKSTQRVKQILESEPNVEVIDFQLGYQDEKRTCFVSSWKENEVTLKDYLAELKLRSNNSKNSWEVKRIAEIEQRVTSIKNKLKDFRDVTDGNMLYNIDTDIITVLDVHEKLSSRKTRNK